MELTTSILSNARLFVSTHNNVIFGSIVHSRSKLKCINLATEENRGTDCACRCKRKDHQKVSYALCDCDTNRYICSSVDFWPFFVSEWAGQYRSGNSLGSGRALSGSHVKVASASRSGGIFSSFFGNSVPVYQAKAWSHLTKK